jgi:hypothetical protein
MRSLRRLCLRLLLAAIAFGPGLTSAATSDSDQLDELDRQEMHAQLDRAARCTREGDFAGAAAAIARARKYQQTSRDRQAIAQAAQEVELARQRVMFDQAQTRYAQESSALEARSEATQRDYEALARKGQAEAARDSARLASEQARAAAAAGPSTYDILMAQSRRNARETTAALQEINRAAAQPSGARAAMPSAKPTHTQGQILTAKAERNPEPQSPSKTPQASIPTGQAKTPERPKTYEYVKGYLFDGGMSKTKEESCANAQAKLDRRDALWFKRLLSSKPCDCSPVRGNYVAYHCTIDAQIEVSSPFPPNDSKSITPSAGISK